MNYTLHKIFDLLWSSKTKERDLCMALDINLSAMTDWKNGKTQSYKLYLSKIAGFFNVSVDDLLYGNFEKQEIRKDKYKLDEIKLINAYNALTDIGKATALHQVEAMKGIHGIELKKGEQSSG